MGDRSECFPGCARVRTKVWSRLNRIDRILIPPRYTFFSGSLPAKNSGVKRAWLGAISGWVTDRDVFLGVHE
jgi:hypothetical protein